MWRVQHRAGFFLQSISRPAKRLLRSNFGFHLGLRYVGPISAVSTQTKNSFSLIFVPFNLCGHPAAAKHSTRRWRQPTAERHLAGWPLSAFTGWSRPTYCLTVRCSCAHMISPVMWRIIFQWWNKYVDSLDYADAFTITRKFSVFDHNRDSESNFTVFYTIEFITY